MTATDGAQIAGTAFALAVLAWVIYRLTWALVQLVWPADRDTPPAAEPDREDGT